MSLTKRNTGYKSVPQEDPIDIQYRPRPQKEDKYIAVLEKIGSYLHSFFWIGLAAATWYYTDLIHIHSDPRVRSMSLASALLAGLIACCAFLYVFIDNYRRGSPNHDYFEEYPKSITVLTFVGLLFWVLLTIALFPVWGWKTIPLIFVNFMGFIMSISILPL